MMLGEGVKITDEMIPNVANQPEVMETARLAGAELGRRLRQGHDRAEVTRPMQAKLMARFKQGVYLTPLRLRP